MSKFSINNSIKLIYNGPLFIQANIDLIKKAKKFIIFQTYIFEEDEVTRPMIELLKTRAKENIDIFILVDGFGSIDFPARTVIELEEAGINFQVFSPLISKNFEHLGRRLHSKLLVVDGTDLLTGGINLSRRFNLPLASAPWLDFSCLISGDEVHTVVRKNLPLYSKYFPKFIEKHYHHLLYAPTNSQCKLKTNVNDWMRLKNEIYTSYLKAIKNSQKQIILVAPYFFPGKKFLFALSCAAARGVRVDLIFSATSDHPMERWSSKHLYSWFLSKNINIYEWGDSIVHGKLALIDDNWVTIGSYNHNFISRFGNHELNIEIDSSNFAQKVQTEIDKIKGKSVKITKQSWKKQNKLLNKLLETLSFIFANVLTLISMLLIIRRKDKSDFNLLE